MKFNNNPRNLLKKIKRRYNIDLNSFKFLYKGFEDKIGRDHTPQDCSLAFRKFLIDRIQQVRKQKKALQDDSEEFRKFGNIEKQISNWIEAVDFWIKEAFGINPSEGRSDSWRTIRVIYTISALHKKTSKFVNFSKYNKVE